MLIHDLIEIYMNEKSTSEMLNYNNDVISFYYNTLCTRKDFLKNSTDDMFIQNVYELEIERIEYLIREYLHIRLEKLKTNFFVDRSLLSSKEILFYDKYMNIMKEKGIVCENSTVCKTVVGFVCKQDLGFVMLDNENVEMYKDDIFVGPYNDIKDLLHNGSIRLI